MSSKTTMEKVPLNWSLEDELAWLGRGGGDEVADYRPRDNQV